MQALNSAIEKAFAHSENDNNIDELLTCLGEELGCKRISIFEENEDGACDNTYEWCRSGVTHERILLQHVEVSQFDTWHDRLINRETIVVQDPEELRAHDPDVYRMFKEQQINSALVTLLAFHGITFGFCILEDPSEAVMADAAVVMPGIRYILSSMIYSRNLVRKLKQLGYIDTLTGVGNRVSLHEHLTRLDKTKAVTAIAVDIIGWDDPEGKPLYLEKEQTLLRASEVLTNLFDGDHVFRVATGEFIVVENGENEDAFKTAIRNIRGLMREHNLLAAVAGQWCEKLMGSSDAIIHEVQQKAEEEKRALMTHRNVVAHIEAPRVEKEGKADIHMPKGDAFFRIAESFLAE